MSARGNLWSLGAATLAALLAAVAAWFDRQQADGALGAAAALRACEARIGVAARKPPIPAIAATAAMATAADQIRAAGGALDNATIDDKALSLSRIMERTRNDPAVVQAGLEAQRVFQRSRYAEFMRQRGLTPTQGEEFLLNVFRDMAGERDVLAAAAALHIPFDDPAVVRLRTQSADAVRDAGCLARGGPRGQGGTGLVRRPHQRLHPRARGRRTAAAARRRQPARHAGLCRWPLNLFHSTGTQTGHQAKG